MSISWRSLRALSPKCKLVGKALLVIAMLDIVISASASMVLGDDYYFKKFLSFSQYEQNKTSRYHEIVDKYFNDSFPLKAKTESGWVNQTGHKDDEWVTCSLGSRVPPTMQGLDRATSQVRKDSHLVFLLGSSVIGGHGSGHGYEDTPGYYLNNLGYKTFDFGTAVYSIDQSYTFYKSNLSEYQPKVLVVGIHNTVEAITNMFNPLMDHDLSIPLLKPAYSLSAGSRIKKHMPPVEAQRTRDYINMISALKHADSQYYKYELYKYLSLLPISDFLRHVILKVDTNFYYDANEYMDAIDLQQHFMNEFVELANQQDIEVIFVKFETLYEIEVPMLQRLFDRYMFKSKNTRHTESLKKTPFNILYTSEIFAETGKLADSFYIEGDGLHFTSHANKLLAEKIAGEINRLEKIKRLN